MFLKSLATLVKLGLILLCLLGLLLSGCKKSKKSSSSINGDTTPLPAPTPTPNPNFYLSLLPDDPEEVLYDGETPLEHTDTFTEDLAFSGIVSADVGMTGVNFYYYMSPELFELYMNYEAGFILYYYNGEGWEKVNWYYPLKPGLDYLTLKGFNPGGVYHFRLVVNYNQWYAGYFFSDYNSVVITLKTKTELDPPNAIRFLSPNRVSAYYFIRPYFSAAGTSDEVSVKVFPTFKEHVRVYQDAACTQELGYGDGYSFERDGAFVTLSGLPWGKTKLYAKIFSWDESLESPCSTASATYWRVTCPEGFVLVDYDYDFNLPPFCVMATEARHGANDVAVTGYSDPPWQTTPQEAKNACRRIGPQCDIITNLEWMAVAKQIEDNQVNWNGGDMSWDEYITSGYTGCQGSGVLNISNPANEYDQLSSADFRYRRTFNLDNGVLWDFGGNLEEWADNAEVGGTEFRPITNTCPRGPYELLDPAFSCAALDSRYYTPLNLLSRTITTASRSYIHNNFYIGRIVGPSAYDLGGGIPLAATRGGRYCDPHNSGIYSLFMDKKMTDTAGFRCVCHLNDE